MRGRMDQFTEEAKRAGEIKTDNIFNYSYLDAAERFKSVAKWYTESEFDRRRKDYQRSA